MRDARSLMTYKWAIALGGVVGLAISPFAFAMASETPQKGPVPASVFTGGSLDKSTVPDFIPALDRAGKQVGYVSRDLAMPDDPEARLGAVIPVYADDLTTVVGTMVPGRGFVPRGASIDSVPPIEVTITER